MSATLGRNLYDDDVLAWSQQQAAALAAAARDDSSSSVDWIHVIATIEAVGREEEMVAVDGVRSVLQCVIAGYCDPDSALRKAWSIDVLRCLGDVRRYMSPSIKGRIDMDGLWREAFDVAMPIVRTDIVSVPPGLSTRCPFTLDQLMGGTFTYESGIKRLYDDLERQHRIEDARP